jgi:hypothetical protein
MKRTNRPGIDEQELATLNARAESALTYDDETWDDALRAAEDDCASLCESLRAAEGDCASLCESLRSAASRDLD